MSLLPFCLHLQDGPCTLDYLEPALVAWAEAEHGPSAVIVRWAVVAGPLHDDGTGWTVEGVAGRVAGAPADTGNK